MRQVDSRRIVRDIAEAQASGASHGARRFRSSHVVASASPTICSVAGSHRIERVGVKTLSIEPGSPWENDYVESFKGKLRDELLDCEVFDTLLEAKVLIGRWREAYNTVRPHSSLGYRPPAPESRRPCLRHPAAVAGGKNAAALAREGHDKTLPARRTACPAESEAEDAAGEV